MHKSKSAWWNLVRFGFRLLYNEMAWTYDTVSWIVSLGQWREWQRTALQLLDIDADKQVLELAHGTGNLQLDLHVAGYQRFACDLSPFMGRIARRKLQRRHIPAPLIRARAQQLPFLDTAFDAVISTFPTAFIFEPETLQEACRVLRPGKKLIIVTGGVLLRGGPIKRALDIAYHATGQRNEPAPQNDIERFFQRAGFTMESVTIPCKRSEAYLIVARKQAKSETA